MAEESIDLTTLESRLKVGDVFYSIPHYSELAVVGMAYKITSVKGNSATAQIVATAVSGSAANVRSMLRRKVKKLGLTP